MNKSNIISSYIVDFYFHGLYIIIVNDTEDVIMNSSVNYSRHTYMHFSDTVRLHSCEVLPRVIIVYRGYAVYEAGVWISS